MSEELLYRIEELVTSGWELVDETGEYRNLTKEQAKQKLDFLIEEGNNPNRLRAVVDNN